MGAKRGGSLRTGARGGRGSRWALAAVVAAVLAFVAALAGCSGGGESGSGSRTSTGVHGPASAVVPPASSPVPSAAPSVPSVEAPPPSPSVAPAASPVPSPGEPVVAEMSIPSIGVEDLDVMPYEGTTDDRAGTRIQDRGVAASPYGERGGVGPGGIGNYLVTAHRLSAGGPLRELPSVAVGDLVHVTAEGTVYTYEIVETRSTSFRSARSLAEQRAAVPGEPGEKPTRAMITLSTCATPEDNAAGNFWRDAQHNPEHRIDKIGVLTSTRSA
ncbi:sortase [Streptomyces sp. NBC_00572]|uniref:sortase domain-containing protein n=1 Tax=Streptomyces sp. NBC_00572 TaxID=2903664 RepID=UPI0022522FA5|nr:sortase [Streptomyces sp. NBC_00572]MCX4980965.1 sortase [Streptomyces sp. NBC_00572]